MPCRSENIIDPNYSFHEDPRLVKLHCLIDANSKELRDYEITTPDPFCFGLGF
ncbi:conserved protein of unknown function [Limnospira indica PCC 8005]|uniref:Uncharacterized protein n=1 Tax=Limnospira indica PCC 8005 TaxID=376219 RepID=A0A9P1P185_9CYAN|nr:conserved protein of unknown function [Limnospira indica PCC 8005]